MNISFSGIYAYSADLIDELTHIMIKVMFTDSSGREQAVCIDGIVIRVTEAEKVYEMGIRFYHYLRPHNKPVLFRHFAQIAAKVMIVICNQYLEIWREFQIKRIPGHKDLHVVQHRPSSHVFFYGP